MIAADKTSWCIVSLREDGNWWVNDSSNDIPLDVESIGILDPKQVERIVDLLSQLRQYGLKDEIVSGALLPFIIEKEMPKEAFRLRLTEDNVFDPRERIFCLPNIISEQEGPFIEFIDHIIALRVKLLNANIDFQEPLDSEEVADILHSEQQDRYISGGKIHAFYEIISILDYVPAGYILDGEDPEPDQEEEEEIDLDLPDFDDEIEESLETEDMKSW